MKYREEKKEKIYIYKSWNPESVLSNTIPGFRKMSFYFLSFERWSKKKGQWEWHVTRVIFSRSSQRRQRLEARCSCHWNEGQRAEKGRERSLVVIQCRQPGEGRWDKLLPGQSLEAGCPRRPSFRWDSLRSRQQEAICCSHSLQFGRQVLPWEWTWWLSL